MNPHAVETILQAIKRLSPLGPDIEVSGDTNLISSGVLDSLTIFRLVETLERDMGWHIPEEKIHPKSFRTALSIASLIQTAQPAQGESAASTL